MEKWQSRSLPIVKSRQNQTTKAAEKHFLILVTILAAVSFGGSLLIHLYNGILLKTRGMECIAIAKGVRVTFKTSVPRRFRTVRHYAVNFRRFTMNGHDWYFKDKLEYLKGDCYPVVYLPENPVIGAPGHKSDSIISLSGMTTVISWILCLLYGFIGFIFLFAIIAIICSKSRLIGQYFGMWHGDNSKTIGN